MMSLASRIWNFETIQWADQILANPENTCKWTIQPAAADATCGERIVRYLGRKVETPFWVLAVIVHAGWTANPLNWAATVLGDRFVVEAPNAGSTYIGAGLRRVVRLVEMALFVPVATVYHAGHVAWNSLPVMRSPQPAPQGPNAE